MDMLPSYYNHILNNENSLLAKYYGLHASRPSNGGEKVTSSTYQLLSIKALL